MSSENSDPTSRHGAPAPFFETRLDDLPADEAFAHILDRALDLSASDVFIMQDEGRTVVSVRHLGLIKRLGDLAAAHGDRLIRHIKVDASLDITERRRPADGRVLLERPGRGRIDLRISSIPTLHGEDLNLRVLNRDLYLRPIDRLGLLRSELNALMSMIESPSGLVLVTGPTGAGKTTTLYAAVQHLNNHQRKINTIEDPIEYDITGLRQSQINLNFGVGFPELLRAVLRQAPDVIMIGEIRDPETAQTAVRAANSGHLVLATLHAPVAAAAIQSMLHLGVSPPFLSTSLLGVVAQRLVRTLCPHCKQPVDLSESPHTFDEVRRWLPPDQGKQMFGPGKCETCLYEGFSDRTGVFEVLSMSPGMRRLVAQSADPQVLYDNAIEEGMVEFRRSALLKVALGVTAIEEIFRAVPTEYLGVEGRG